MDHLSQPVDAVVHAHACHGTRRLDMPGPVSYPFQFQVGGDLLFRGAVFLVRFVGEKEYGEGTTPDIVVL